MRWDSLYLFAWVALASASALLEQPRPRHITLPISKRADNGPIVGGTAELGDTSDFFYTIDVKVGSSITTLNLDTGSSDLWVADTACQTTACNGFTGTRYDTTTFKSSGNQVALRFGDSTTGTHANGPAGRDTVTVAGIVIANQTLAAVNDTDNSALAGGAAGILGLGFPAESFVQEAVVVAENAVLDGTDTFLEQTVNSGPVLSRLILNDVIDEPLFSITLQRDTIDVSGQGQITIGALPDGVDNSSLTWVPVRLYSPSEGGLNPPSFAPNDIYPLRWEVPLDGVFLDGTELSDSVIPANNIPNPGLSALIDTGNSLVRGPADVVAFILATVSPARAKSTLARPILPCDGAHSLAYKIGGKLFPIDPRDFVSQAPPDGSGTPQCSADSIVATDPPSTGALFSWSLGDPFLKSNLVSLVPDNAAELLAEAVAEAQKDGGTFDSKTDVPDSVGTAIRQSNAATSTTRSRKAKPTKSHIVWGTSKKWAATSSDWSDSSTTSITTSFIASPTASIITSSIASAAACPTAWPSACPPPWPSTYSAAWPTALGQVELADTTAASANGGGGLSTLERNSYIIIGLLAGVILLLLVVIAMQVRANKANKGYRAVSFADQVGRGGKPYDAYGEYSG
ncbi:aspartic peptidase domain-containing protein [Lenzites betulinus]|nr:aspartic peptidase domain-containing protein [Lenzites betulinus]